MPWTVVPRSSPSSSTLPSSVPPVTLPTSPNGGVTTSRCRQTGVCSLPRARPGPPPSRQDGPETISQGSLRSTKELTYCIRGVFNDRPLRGHIRFDRYERVMVCCFFDKVAMLSFSAFSAVYVLNGVNILYLSSRRQSSNPPRIWPIGHDHISQTIVVLSIASAIVSGPGHSSHISAISVA